MNLVPPGMNVVIFSKDRAMQLDLLLQSMKRFAPVLLEAVPKIIYTHSSTEFARGYMLLETTWQNQVSWIFESDIQKQFLEAVNPAAKYTSCLVDDDVFFRPLPKLPELNPGEAYVPRLGKNCTYCYNADKLQKEGELDFDCTVSVDGHVYLTKEFRQLIEMVQLDSGAPPGRFEEQASGLKKFKLLYAEHSCLVNIVANRVQERYRNRCAGGSPEDLNKRFLNGYRLDLDAIDFSNVIGVHQDIELKFVHVLEMV